MTFSKLYFNKELNELTYKDIEDFFIDEKDESDKIEFKSFFSTEEKNQTEKENGVIRAICALLNSEGGIVIWGAPVGQTVAGKKEKIFKGALSPLNLLIEKDYFIRRITDSITPSPNNIRFQPIQSGQYYIYIIEVEQSSYSPHQFKNVYYMRIDGQSRPAPHHYIEALFRKITYPKLEGYIVVDHFLLHKNGYSLQLTALIFNQSKLQNEHDLYYRLIVVCGEFALFRTNTDINKIYGMEGHELRVLNAKKTLYYNEPIRNSEVIYVSTEELIKHNFECIVHFYFGGKKSPLMVSKYKLNLREFGRKNSNEYFVSIDENKLTSKASDEMDISQEDRMKKILGR